MAILRMNPFACIASITFHTCFIEAPSNRLRDRALFEGARVFLAVEGICRLAKGRSSLPKLMSCINSCWLGTNAGWNTVKRI